MKVTYTSPNRSHHYPYAEQLARADALHAFVSGYPRMGYDAALEVLQPYLKRADQVQLLFLLANRLHAPTALKDYLAYLSKVYLDCRARKFAANSDIYLFYNGAGLSTLHYLRKHNCQTQGVVEAVNSHVTYQENLLREEHQLLKLPFRSFPRYEVARRLAEYHESQAVLCPSHFVKQSFVDKGVAEASIYVVPYGFTPPCADNTDASKASNDFIVLYVGQISVRKGLRYLIEGFKKFSHPRKRLWIVGPKVHPSGIDDLTIPAHVKFWGVQKGAALAKLYQQASVFVQPSIEEGLSLVMAEALSFGTPVIATYNTGAKDLFTDGTGGYHIPIRDHQAIAQHLQELADDPDKLQSMQEQALEQSKLIGGWKMSGENLVAALNKICNSVKN